MSVRSRRAHLPDGYGWVGTWNGLNRLDRETDAFTRWQHDPENPRGLGLSRVNALLEDRSGHRHDPADPHSLADDRIYALHEDEAGRLWVGTCCPRGGACRAS